MFDSVILEVTEVGSETDKLFNEYLIWSWMCEFGVYLFRKWDALQELVCLVVIMGRGIQYCCYDTL